MGGGRGVEQMLTFDYQGEREGLAIAYVSFLQFELAEQNAVNLSFFWDFTSKFQYLADTSVIKCILRLNIICSCKYVDKYSFGKGGGVGRCLYVRWGGGVRCDAYFCLIRGGTGVQNRPKMAYVIKEWSLRKSKLWPTPPFSLRKHSTTPSPRQNKEKNRISCLKKQISITRTSLRSDSTINIQLFDL